MGGSIRGVSHRQRRDESRGAVRRSAWIARPVRYAAAAGAVAVAVAAFGGLGASASGRSTRASGPSVTWAVVYPIKTLDPNLVYDGGGNNFMAYQECDALLRFGSNLKLQPELARSWHQASPTKYVYNLRSDVKFWDGNPLTPADVAFSVNRIQDPKLASPLASLAGAGSIKKAVVSGPHQVTILLKKANPIAQWLPATPIGQVVEKSFALQKGKAFGTSVNDVMCSGAYKPTSWVK